MKTIPIMSDSLIVWAGYYWGQWHIPFTAFLIGIVIGFMWLLYRLFKENPVDLANDVLTILSELGLKTLSSNNEEGLFGSSAIHSTISTLRRASSQKEGFLRSATNLGDGLPCAEPTGLNRMSSDHRESLSESHSDEQWISTSGEKSP